MSHRDLLRLFSGILAAVTLPLGVALLCTGAMVERPRSGSPDAFLYSGAALAATGAGLALVFVALSRRAAAERRRRHEGARGRATVVRARWNPRVRSGHRIGVELTVRLAAAAVAREKVTRTLLLEPGGLAEGQQIAVAYDPADPANFEPLPA